MFTDDEAKDAIKALREAIMLCKSEIQRLERQRWVHIDIRKPIIDRVIETRDNLVSIMDRMGEHHGINTIR